MKVDVEHFRDAGEQDANGDWDYYYEGDLFIFSSDPLAPTEAVLRARIYSDEPKRASFIERRDKLDGSPLATDAVDYLRRRGVTEIHCLGGSGYSVWWSAD